MTVTITPSSAPLSSYAATIQYSKELLVQAQMAKSMRRRLQGPIPSMSSMLNGQLTTPSGYPIISSFDLSKGNDGDRITFDLLTRVNGKPIMGDRIAGDKSSGISFQRDQVAIDQYTNVVSAGGRMAQQRTPHNLRQASMGLQLNWIGNLEDNLFHAHLAGARGYETGDHWVVPLATDPDFGNIMVNPLLPPTFSRKFYPGTATSLANLSTTNTLTLNFFDDLKTRLVKGSAPLKGVNLGDGIGGDDSSPLFVSIISEEGWNQLLKDTSAQNWRTFLAASAEREMFKKHPLFADIEFGIWRGIAIFHTPRAISFPATSTASEYDANNALQTVTAAVNAHRGIIMGAEALGIAYGNSRPYDTTGNSGKGQTAMLGPYSWVEQVEDGGNLLKVYLRMIAGMKKLTYNFRNPAGIIVPFDNGVAAFDYYVPNV